MKRPETTFEPLVRILSYSIVIILVLLPFHALLTTLLGARFGHLDAFRIWKEIIIALMVPFAFFLAIKTLRLRTWLRSDKIVKLLLLYAGLTIIAGIIAVRNGDVNSEALIYALIINLRFLGFFAVVFAVASLANGLKKQWLRLLIWPALVVIVFGVLQQFALAPDFLANFGYGPETIPAYQLVDQKLEYVRIQSTLRGANPLGVYLVLILSVLAVMLRHRQSERLKMGTIMLLAGVVLIFTYSRSAWLGVVLSLGAIAWLSLRSTPLKSGLLLGGICLLLIISSSLWILRDNNLIQNTVFHTDETSLSGRSSNDVRASALTSGVRSVMKEPLGRGPGTAGPASFRNDSAPRVAENYYVQLGQEVGLVGVAIFVAINVIIGYRLWLQRRDMLSLALLSSLIGITFANLLSHAWADDTVSLLWWGFAAIALASYRHDGVQSREER